MTQDVQLYRRRDAQLPDVLKHVFFLEDDDKELMQPLQADIELYRSVELPEPKYRPIPDRSRGSLFLEDLAQGTHQIGTALLGSHKKAMAYDSDSSADEEVVPVVNPKMAALSVGAFAVSGLSQMALRQCDHERQQALEDRARQDKGILARSKRALVQAEFNQTNTQLANRDKLDHRKESHRFLLEQMRHRNDQMQIKAEMGVALFETQLQAAREREKMELEQDRIAAQQQVVVYKSHLQHQAQQMEVQAGLFENSQQLAQQSMQSFEQNFSHLTSHMTQQARLEREHSSDLFHSALNFAAHIMDKTLQLLHLRSKKEAPSQQTAPSDEDLALARIRPEIREDVVRLKSPKFASVHIENRCFDGLSIYQLLTTADTLTSATREELRYLFDLIVDVQLQSLAQDGHRLTRSAVIRRLYSNGAGNEFLEYILQALSSFQRKESILEELLMLYAANFKLIK